MDILYLVLPIAGAFVMLFLVCVCGDKVKQLLHIPKEVVMMPGYADIMQARQASNYRSSVNTRTNANTGNNGVTNYSSDVSSITIQDTANEEKQQLILPQYDWNDTRIEWANTARVHGDPSNAGGKKLTYYKIFMCDPLPPRCNSLFDKKLSRSTDCINVRSSKRYDDARPTNCNTDDESRSTECIRSSFGHEDPRSTDCIMYEDSKSIECISSTMRQEDNRLMDIPHHFPPDSITTKSAEDVYQTCSLFTPVLTRSVSSDIAAYSMDSQSHRTSVSVQVDVHV